MTRKADIPTPFFITVDYTVQNSTAIIRPEICNTTKDKNANNFAKIKISDFILIFIIMTSYASLTHRSNFATILHLLLKITHFECIFLKP